MTPSTGVFVVQAHERIVFGQPAGETVADEAVRHAARRVFLVTNRSLAHLDDGPVQRVVKALGMRHAGTFAAMSAHSRCEDVVAAANMARNAGADLLVAIGGGSVIDGTKAALLCLWHNLDTIKQLTGLAGSPHDADMPVAHAVRAIAVPTTFSAAEFTSAAAVNDEATRTKHVLSHRLFAPQSVVLDPEATLPTPLQLLLATGMRAIDHAVETYCSLAANPVTEMFSMQGLKLLAQALPAIVDDPHDLATRLQAQLGMWQAVAPVAAGVSVGASHGIGYVLGGSYGVPHGETSCVLLPAVLRWNAEVNAVRQRELARAVGAPNEDLPAFIARLVENLGLPRSLDDLGIRGNDLDDIAIRALVYPAVAANPRSIHSEADVRRILETAR
ncbi:iron-containing alcohol dehydrogenase [Simplicispira suum]|uniref:Maleylacetate reductase n=1 Tax=Simplicispira suum TaxID=2109915 RepID=A0A2S0N5W0_9BURK|nr:iron-containing alcohol dehydrogenase [Simplicispira suum]AVO43528.1 maleylacetate reductase [Simplicispira suum]